MQSTAQAAAEDAQAVPAAEPPPAAVPLGGFIIPIAGACLTRYEGHLPSAVRAYRDGTHEGFDFYEWAAGTEINAATPVLAAKAGIVSRADLDYVEVTPAEWAAFESAGWQGEPLLDRLRGRQVWIDHGGGIATRYAHLGGIAPGIAPGVQVEAGQPLGAVGESGQSAVWEAPGTDLHLHFEIRVGDRYLGEGLAPLAARSLYLNAFGVRIGSREDLCD